MAVRTLHILLLVLLLSSSMKVRAQGVEASCTSTALDEQARQQDPVEMTASTSESDFWQLADGPYGGEVLALRTLSDGSVVALGGAYPVGAIFRSTDDGRSWQHTGIQAGGMARDPSTPSGVLAHRGGCLYQSRDGGLSWTSNCLNADSMGWGDALGARFEDIAATASGRIYGVVETVWSFACWESDFSLWYSDDAGRTWHEMDETIEDYSTLTVLADTLLVQESGVDVAWRTADGGWHPLPSVPAGITSLAGHPGDTLLAGTYDGLYEITDVEGEWVKRDVGSAEGDDQTVHDMTLLADKRICVAGPGVQCESASGRFKMVGPYEQLRQALGHVLAVTATGRGDLLAGGDGSGIYRYDMSTGVWQMSADGLRQHPLQIMAETADGKLYSVAGNNLYVSEDGGGSWQIRARSLQGGTAALFATEDELLLRATRSSVHRSTNAGTTWETVATHRVSRFTRRSDGSIIGVGEKEVFMASPEGREWQQIGVLDTTFFELGVRHVTDEVGGELYVGARYSVLRSTDGGVSWKMVLDVPPPDSGAIPGSGALADLARTSTGALLVVFPDSALRSVDGGANWNKLPSVRWRDAYGANLTAGLDSTVYLTYEDKLWISTDDGQTWTQSADGSGIGTFRAMHITKEGYLLTGAGSAAYRSRHVRPTSADEEHVPLLRRVALHAVAPNPTRSRTTVYYSLVTPSQVRLTLYDVLGRLVRRVADGRHGPGKYEVHLDTAGLAPGSYFIQLMTPEGSQTKPLIVVQ